VSGNGSVLGLGGAFADEHVLGDMPPGPSAPIAPTSAAGPNLERDLEVLEEPLRGDIKPKAYLATEMAAH
jgi:hypothetical protein